jgi:hypothetical protein
MEAVSLPKGNDAGCSSRDEAKSGGAAPHAAPLVFAGPTPNPMLLSGRDRPGEAIFAHLAAAAHGLSLLDLPENLQARLAKGKEEIRVLV